MNDSLMHEPQLNTKIEWHFACGMICSWRPIYFYIICWNDFSNTYLLVVLRRSRSSWNRTNWNLTFILPEGSRKSVGDILSWCAIYQSIECWRWSLRWIPQSQMSRIPGPGNTGDGIKCLDIPPLPNFPDFFFWKGTINRN